MKLTSDKNCQYLTKNEKKTNKQKFHDDNLLVSFENRKKWTVITGQIIWLRLF